MARKSVIIVVAILISVICLEALGQVKFNVQDLNYGGNPFNPGDVARVHRVRLSDKYDTNKWDVFLTKIVVENVGNATNDEIVWLEVRLGNSRQLHPNRRIRNTSGSATHFIHCAARNMSSWLCSNTGMDAGCSSTTLPGDCGRYLSSGPT